jgi:peptide deformylase
MKYPKLEKLHILHYPDPRLRVKAGDLEKADSFLKELSDRMAELMYGERGIGLASTQVGLTFRFVVLGSPDEPGKYEAFINPVILSKEGQQVAEEGCLSVPGVWAKVKRAEKVVVRATRLNGEQVELQAEGFLARAWQHEIDHLEGGLFVDRVGPASRIVLAGKLREMEQKFTPPSGEDEDADGRP